MKNHKGLLKINWLETSLPRMSSSQGFSKALLWCSPFVRHWMLPEPGPRKNVQEGGKALCYAAAFSSQVPSQAFFFYCFPEIKPLTASCPLLSWNGGLMVLLFFSNHVD